MSLKNDLVNDHKKLSACSRYPIDAPPTPTPRRKPDGLIIRPIHLNDPFTKDQPCFPHFAIIGQYFPHTFARPLRALAIAGPHQTAPSYTCVCDSPLLMILYIVFL